LIADGVVVAGIDVGGMRGADARVALRRHLRARMNQPVAVTAPGAEFVLRPRRVGLRAHVDAMVERARAKSREGNVVSRTLRALAGGELAVAVPPTLSFSRAKLRRFAERVARRTDRKARDARVEASAGGLRKIPSRPGRAVAVRRLEASLAAALTDARRTVKAPVEIVAPRVTTAELPERYPRFLTVDRGAFRLRLYERLRLARTYAIAVGQVGFETPEGLYHIQNKAVDPAWSVPNSDWAGDLAGTVVPGGVPENPLKARWLGIYDGAGIHGTDQTQTLGTAASRGCIRMAIPEVKQLYERIPVGTPIYIG
jgi:hypothetical protein